MSYRRDRDFLFEDNVIPKNSVGCEIGVWKGEFSYELLTHTNPKKLILIDPWKYVAEYETRWYGGPKMSQEKMELIYQDVVEWHGDRPNVQIIRGTVEDLSEMVDWIYIDGDHSEEPCFNDLMTSYQFVRKMFIVDDMEWDGVVNAVNRFLKEHPNCKARTQGNQCIILKD